MKFWPTRFLFTIWLAFALTSLPALRAAAFAEPAEAKPETPAPAPAAVEPEKTEASAVETAKPEMEKAAAAATTDEKTISADSEEPKVPEPATPPVKGKKSRTRTIGYNSHSQHSGNERVSVFHDSSLAAGEKSGAVVSIFGSSTSAGEVDDVVLSVIGSSTSSGNVGNGVVSIIGNNRVTGGTVGDTAVAVLGNNYINGHVKGEVVAVLGNIELGPDAVVDGEVICVGGDLVRDAKAVVHGNVQNIAIGGHHFNFDGIHAWFEQCLLYARPLAFGANLTWAWGIAFLFLGFYALIALVAPAGVEKCVSTLEERPGKSILAAVLTLLLTPVAFVLILLTVFIAVGVVLIPLFSLGLFFASLFGKVVMLAWLGRRLTKLAGDGPLAKPVFSVLVGGMIVMLLYTVPILGFVLYKLLGVLGLGVVVCTLLLQLKSNRVAAASRAAARQAAMPPPVSAEVPPPMVASLPPVISALTLPRAGFWRRLGATLLDLIMVGIVLGMLDGIFRPIFRVGGAFPVWFALYNVALWATKGTTIGGIICGLKLVRLDDRPLEWSVAIVRGLSAFLSLAVAGFGFIWVAVDDEKQSWHDKIAGTTIVIVPKGTPLL